MVDPSPKEDTALWPEQVRHLEDTALGPEQVRHLEAPNDSALADCLMALLPSSVDARALIDLGAVYVNRVR